MQGAWDGVSGEEMAGGSEWDNEDTGDSTYGLHTVERGIDRWGVDVG